MPCDAWSLCNLFKRKGTNLEAQNSKTVNFTSILDLKSQFFGHSEPLIGFEKVAEGPRITLQNLGTHSAAQNSRKIGIWGPKWP